MNLNRLYDPTMTRFLLVGVVNTIVGTGTMFMLYNLLGCSYWVSSAANYIVGGVCSFLLNKSFTFNNTERSWGQVLKFVLTVSGCYFVGYGVAKIITMWMLGSLPLNIQENVAMCIGMFVYVAMNYFFQRFFVFKKV